MSKTTKAATAILVALALILTGNIARAPKTPVARKVQVEVVV